MAGIKFDFTADNKNLLNSAKQAQTGVTNAINGIERAGRGIETTFTKIKDSALGGFADIAKGMAGLTALLQAGNFFKTLIDDAAKFNVAMKEVSTLSEEVADNLQEYKSKVVDMTTEIAIAPTDAAKALYQIESAGHHGADGLNVLRESAKTAIGGVTDTATAADAITTVLNAYKMDASEAQHVSDLLFTTVRLGKTNMTELGHSMAQVAPVAAAYGVSIEDVLAAIASLTKQGTPTAIAIRQVRDAITATTASLGDAAFQGRSFLDAMDDVARKSQGSNNALKDDLSKLGAINAVLELTGKNAASARQDMQEMQNSAGAAESAYQKMASTAGTQTTLLRNNIFKAILPLAEGIKSMSGDIAHYFNEAFDSGAMDKALVSLEAFIAAYATYRGLLAATTAWNTAALGGTYQLQIAELQKLIPLKELDGQADLQAAVAKGTLTTEQAKLVASLRVETEARYEEIMAAESEARANLKALTAAEASATANVTAAEEMVAAAQARVAAATQSGVATDIDTAKEELNTAEMLRNDAMRQKSIVTRQREGAQTMVSITAKNAETAATLMNTTQQGANTVATGILATAKLQLKKAIDAVNSSFLASPLFWIAAAIAGVTYAVYKLVTAESAHDAAVRKTNEALEEQKKQLDDRRNSIDGLIRTIQDENSTEYQKVKAYDELKKTAPDIAEAYSKEAIATMEAADAQKMLNKSMDEAEYEELVKKVREAEKAYRDAVAAGEAATTSAQYGYYDPGADYTGSQLEAAEAQLEILKKALAEADRLREEARIAAEEAAKPIELRIEEAKSNQAEKQRILDFYDNVMVHVDDIQSSQNLLNFDEAQNKLDAYISEIQTELADLHQQVQQNPLDQKLQIEEQEKAKLLSELLTWQSSMHAGGYTTIPLFFKANWESAQQALDQARTHYQGLFSQIPAGGAQSMADLYASAKGDYEAALKEWQRVSNPANRASVTPEEYNKAKSKYETTKSAYEAAGGDPDGKKARAAASAARQAAQSAKQLRQQQEQERKQLEKYQQMLKKQQLEQKRDAEDMAYDTRQAEIEKLDEGTERTLKQIQLDFEKQETAIKRGYEDLKQAKIDAARALWEANPDTKDKPFDESTVDVSYTQAEIDNYNAQIAANEAQRRRSLEEFTRQQSQALNEYLQEYGTYEQKRLAITEEYSAKIAKAQSMGERLSLERQMENALSQLDMSQLEKSINWEVIFNDLDKLSLEHLQKLKQQLKDALDNKEITAEQAQTISERIGAINEQIQTKAKEWRSAFGLVIPELEEMRRLEREAVEAQERLNQATNRYNNALEDVVATRKEILALLEREGIEASEEDITTGNADQFAGYMQLMGKDTQELAGLFSKLGKQENALAQNTEALAGAEAEAGTAAEAAGGSFATTVAIIDTIVHKINDNIQSMNELLDQMGLSDTKFGRGFSKFAESSEYATKAWESLKSGNVMGVANGVYGSLRTLGEALGEWGVGGMGSSDTSLHDDIERLTQSNEDLQKAIDNLAEKMEDSAVVDATALFEQQKQKLNESMANTQEMMQRSASAYSNGFLGIGGHHSSSSKINDSVSSAEWDRISKLLGKSVRGAGDFFRLTSEEMYKVATEATDIYTHIKDLANDGYEDAAQFMDDYIEYWKQLEELQNAYYEKMTSVSFDTLESDFKSKLMDMDSDAEDFADDFEKYLQQAIINSLVSEKYKPLIEQWYKMFASFMADGIIDAQEQAALHNGGSFKNTATGEWETAQGWDDITAAGVRDRNALKEQFGWGDNFSQEASKKAYEGMSQEVGQNLVGRATAIQIADEKVAANMLTVVALLTGFSSSVMANNTVLVEMRNLLIIGNSYLEDVAKYSKSIYRSFGEKIDKLIEQTK